MREMELKNKIVYGVENLNIIEGNLQAIGVYPNVKRSHLTRYVKNEDLAARSIATYIVEYVTVIEKICLDILSHYGFPGGVDDNVFRKASSSIVSGKNIFSKDTLENLEEMKRFKGTVMSQGYGYGNLSNRVIELLKVLPEVSIDCKKGLSDLIEYLEYR